MRWLYRRLIPDDVIWGLEDRLSVAIESLSLYLWPMTQRRIRDRNARIEASSGTLDEVMAKQEWTRRA